MSSKNFANYLKRTLLSFDFVFHDFPFKPPRYNWISRIFYDIIIWRGCGGLWMPHLKLKLGKPALPISTPYTPLTKTCKLHLIVVRRVVRGMKDKIEVFFGVSVLKPSWITLFHHCSKGTLKLGLRLRTHISDLELSQKQFNYYTILWQVFHNEPL